VVACSAAPGAGGPNEGQPSAGESSEPSASGGAIALDGLPGRIIYTRFTGDGGWESDFLGNYVIQTDGSEESPLPTPDHIDTYGPNWSPDGKRLVVTVLDFDAGILGRPAIVEPDGSGFTMVEPEGLPGFVSCSDWSPDGAHLLCAYDYDEHPDQEGIYQIAVDASTVMRLTEAPHPSVVGTQGECGGGDYGASYSPDGTRFAFVRMQCGVQADPSRDQTAEVWVGNVDGTGLTAITPSGLPHSHGPGVGWSPDGAWILFGSEDGSLNLVTPDGSDLTRIALDGPSGYAHMPTWSPDGAYILFSMRVRATDTTNLFIARADGTGMTQVTNTPNGETFASWGL
jgi:Tol biopolymer transport system component